MICTKRLSAWILVIVSILGFAGCCARPDVIAESDIDSIIISYSFDGGASNEEVRITDKEIISELCAMHNSLRTEEMSRPIADERMWIIFCQDGKTMIEWCISSHDDGMLITCSTMLGMGNHVVRSEFDYNRLVRIFDTAAD